LKHGYGFFEFSDARKYIGDWKNGVQHGNGIYITSAGELHEGVWVEGRLDHWFKTVMV
jgi:hypothetical protein